MPFLVGRVAAKNHVAQQPQPRWWAVLAPLWWLLLVTAIQTAAAAVAGINSFALSAQQQAQCASELIATDVNVTDGYLSLSEYQVFVNARYYANCSVPIVVADSVPQWSAFTELACYSCLGEFVFVDKLPDCCLPFNNSRISIKRIANDSAWLDRICSTADQAAVQDSCYTSPPTQSLTNSSFSPSMVPIIQNATTAVTPSAAVSPVTNAMVVVGNASAGCNQQLVAADVNQTDGYLNFAEFQGFLTSYWKSCNHTNCATAGSDDTTLNMAAYASLACVSCLSATSNLSCCADTSSFAGIPIAGASNNSSGHSNNSPALEAEQQQVWLTRLCTTAESLTRQRCNATTITTTTNTTTATTTAAPFPSPKNSTDNGTATTTTTTKAPVAPSKNDTVTTGPQAPTLAVVPHNVTTSLAPVTPTNAAAVSPASVNLPASVPTTVVVPPPAPTSNAEGRPWTTNARTLPQLLNLLLLPLLVPPLYHLWL